MKVTKTFLNKLVKDPILVLKGLSKEDIASIIQQANFAYYNSDKPWFQDNTFDIIKEYLEALDPENPILKNIGSSVSEGKKVELPFFMGSLDKIKTDPKLIEKFKTTYPGSYIISDKLDGNSALLCYKGGNMQLFSRGDGTVGQDISHLLPFIQHIATPTSKSEFAVRGELIISKADFKNVADKGANARNMVAGVMNAKMPDLALARLVQFVSYELLSPQLIPEDQMKTIIKMGMKCVYSSKITDLTVDTLSSILVDRRQNSEFEVDGIVVAHNHIHVRPKENPKYAFAFKSIQTMSKAEVIVTHVEWNTSKDGYLIPVINFAGVSLSGVTIKRAHGFNGKFIKDNVIGPGSKIVIMRSGDVIPYVESVVSAADTGKPQMPEMDYIWTSTGVDIIQADMESDEVVFKNIEYFFNKIDFVGLGAGNLRKIFDGGYKTVYDILNITKQQLLGIDTFKEKMATKILESIAAKKDNIDCISLMDASNTLGRGIGSRKLSPVVEKYPKIVTEMYIPTKAELLEIKGIENKTAMAIITGLSKYHKFVKDNKLECYHKAKTTTNTNTNTNTQQQTFTDKTQFFKDQIVVFTGFRSKPLEEFIVNNGGTVTSSISKKTTLVIRKDDEESTKVDKARELNITIQNLSAIENKYNIKAK